METMESSIKRFAPWRLCVLALNFYAAPTALRKGGRETLKEKLKPYLQAGEWSE
jgi:hypothetical protein